MQGTIGKIRQAINRRRSTKIISIIFFTFILCSCAARQIREVRVPVGSKINPSEIPQKPFVDVYTMVDPYKTYKSNGNGAVCLSHKQFLRLESYIDSLKRTIDKLNKKIVNNNNIIDKTLQEMSGIEEKGFFGKLLEKPNK